MSIKLKQPIINGSLPATNFFNGRLVTGADLTREQTSRRKAVWRAGKAAGEGIVYGLEVGRYKTAGDKPIVSVNKGLAVNRCGQALLLSQNTSVDLLERFGTIEPPSTIFEDCKRLEVGTYAAGFGFYLLVLSPAQTSQGSAPTSGLNNAFASCNTDVILETAQFNLLPIDPILKGEALPVNKLLRNYIAYRSFGAAKSQKFFEDPLGFSLASYGLIDEMRSKLLADSDVPLAIVRWTSKGLEFVEMWAVRRRMTRRDDDKDWTQLVKDRRRSETEAMMMQFADQIESLDDKKTDLTTIPAAEYFDYLPPAGILPTAVSAGQGGFNRTVFFGAKSSTPATIDGDRLRVLLEQALSHEPINLKGGDGIQLYYVKENPARNNQRALVFARHSLPYLGHAVSKSHFFTFAPNFMRIDDDEQTTPWEVTFNKATVPGAQRMVKETEKREREEEAARGEGREEGEARDEVRGAFLVRLPDDAQIDVMIVRGKRLDDETDAQGKPVERVAPKEFRVSLRRSEFEAREEKAEVLITLDLKEKEKGKPFAEKEAVRDRSLAVVNNTQYHYYLDAYWANEGNSARFEIHSIQIFCSTKG